MTALTITPMASIEDLARALAAEGLPVDDIEDDGRAFFAFHHAGQCIGFGGSRAMAGTASCARSSSSARRAVGARGARPSRYWRARRAVRVPPGCIC